MTNKKLHIIFLLFLSLILLFSGCLEIFNSNDKKTTYQNLKTEISYDISYGVKINCTGTGFYEIIYSCDLPEVLLGKTSIISILNEDYKNLTNQATFNDFKYWNISKNGNCSSYTLGISANVVSNIFNFNDLNGNNALTRDEIKKDHKDKIRNYCKSQSNETIVFIDPNNSNIKSKAEEIKNDIDTNNSFVLAKELFIWLKKNTKYETHLFNQNVQPANLTFDKKLGDCDDLTYLYLSLCKSIDIPARFIRGFLVDGNGKAVAHAWAEVFVGIEENNGWIPVECAGDIKNKDEITSEIHQNFAFESTDHLRLFIDDGSNESLKLSLTGVKYSSDDKINYEQPVFFADVSNYKVISRNKLSINKDNIRTLV